MRRRVLPERHGTGRTFLEPRHDRRHPLRGSWIEEVNLAERSSGASAGGPEVGGPGVGGPGVGGLAAGGLAAAGAEGAGRDAAGEVGRAVGDRLGSASDGLLARRAADGDALAFEILLRRHLGLMTAYATRLTSSQADAYDAVQEASIAIWRQLPRLTTPDAVRGWMMRIVSRKAFDLLRSRKPTSDIDDAAVELLLPVSDFDDPARQAAATEAMSGLRLALDRLPELQRQSWLLREVGGESYGEIAQHLGITTSAARGQLARARETLTREMEAWR
jgi:RNA polymerase sigma-70 factor (ECF subfamily)